MFSTLHSPVITIDDIHHHSLDPTHNQQFGSGSAYITPVSVPSLPQSPLSVHPRLRVTASGHLWSSLYPISLAVLSRSPRQCRPRLLPSTGGRRWPPARRARAAGRAGRGRRPLSARPAGRTAAQSPPPHRRRPGPADRPAQTLASLWTGRQLSVGPSRPASSDTSKSVDRSAAVSGPSRPASCDNSESVDRSAAVSGAQQTGQLRHQRVCGPVGSCQWGPADRPAQTPASLWTGQQPSVGPADRPAATIASLWTGRQLSVGPSRPASSDTSESVDRSAAVSGAQQTGQLRHQRVCGPVGSRQWAQQTGQLRHQRVCGPVSSRQWAQQTGQLRHQQVCGPVSSCQWAQQTGQLRHQRVCGPVGSRQWGPADRPAETPASLWTGQQPSVGADVSANHSTLSRQTPHQA